MSQYKPYSPEWHRKRYLKEALDKYLDDYIDNDVILEDIEDILNSRSAKAYTEFEKTNQLEWMIRKNAK
jgi:predicted oxidoreductase